ncbi:MAG TPA: 4a-hydroxytetrahydrobiopterin dehydratase [Bryobacteraceae bacterium]|nr:4a-hydroxytetrahydrobiopterin dehydratase [Bryobacteraceae bacterium]
MTELTRKRCTPCRGGIPPLSGAALAALQDQLPFWKVIEGHHLAKSFLFRNFKSGLEFVNRIGLLAEEEGHHPDLHLSWGKVDVEIYTHKIDGLSENDFILAAKIDQAFFRKSS